MQGVLILFFAFDKDLCGVLGVVSGEGVQGNVCCLAWMFPPQNMIFGGALVDAGITRDSPVASGRNDCLHRQP